MLQANTIQTARHALARTAVITAFTSQTPLSSLGTLFATAVLCLGSHSGHQESECYIVFCWFVCLALSPLQICSALIAQLTKRFLSDHAASEAMSARLRQLCPSLYSADDAIITQAAEALAVAKTKSDKEERQRLLEDSLKVSGRLCYSVLFST